MPSTLDNGWTLVSEYVDEAKLIAWDECHKIYLAMDDTQADWFRVNYPVVVDGSPEHLLSTLEEWFDKSCWLRFINAVSTNEADPNAGFVTLIPQGAEENDDWYDDEDDDC